MKPLLIIAAFIIGGVFPQLGELRWLIRYLLMLMLYLVFLQLDVRQISVRRSHFLLLGFEIVFAVGCYWFFNALGCKALAEAAFFTAVTPTATAAPVIIRFLGGNANYVVTAFVVTNFGITAVLMWLLPWLICGKSDLQMFLHTACNLLVLVAVPALLAALTRKVWAASVQLPGKLTKFSFLMWVVLLCIISGASSEFIRNNHDISPGVLLATAVVSLIICAVNFFVGGCIDRKFKSEASQSCGQKNTSFTIVLATTFVSPLAAMGPTFYVLWHNLWNAAQLFLHDRKK